MMLFCSFHKIAIDLPKNCQNDYCSTRFFHNLTHQRFRTIGKPLNDTQVGFFFNLHEVLESSVDFFAVYEAFRIQLFENFISQMRESSQDFLHNQLSVCNCNLRMQHFYY